MSDFFIDKSNPRWQHYFLCGYRGIQEHFNVTPQGINVMLEGTVPKSAGLSSSSALVCCAAVATMKAHSQTLTKVKWSFNNCVGVCLPLGIFH